MVLSQDMKSAFKLAQLQALPIPTHREIIEKILKQDGDINFAVPVDSLYRILGQNVAGYTILHFAATIMDSIDFFTSLLNHGADFTKKNGDGQTVLHMLIAKHNSVKKPVNNPYINAVLSTHVTSKNFSNPCNNHGLSHFHIACMTSNKTAVQFFLDNGVPIDEPVSMDSKISRGYTPLHIAAMCTNTEVAEILFAHGVNMHVANASGRTPLHLLIERRIEMHDSIGNAMRKKDHSYMNLQEEIGKNEKIINMLLENTSIDHDCLDSIGLSTFHVACMLQDTSAAQHLVGQVDLDHCVNVDSRLWPGYTALHFAAHVSIETVEMLMKARADIEKADSKGLTPLDLCIERYKIDDICRIMSLNTNWKDIIFSDGKTLVLSLIQALTDAELFRKLMNCSSTQNINMRIPVESPLWPGYSPLHLAVLFAEKPKRMFLEDGRAQNIVDLRIIQICLKIGADLTVQDSRGRTPLHLAFRLKKMTIIDEIISLSRRIPNISDEDNLSHLHIVCTVGRANMLKKCVLNVSEVNAAYRGTSPINCVRPGSTPLHVCLASLQSSADLSVKIRILLKSGANLHVKDASGLTPVHRILELRFVHEVHKRSLARTVLAKVTKDCVAEEHGLNYLHVACKLESQPAVKRLIKDGADVNLAIEYSPGDDDDSLAFLSRYDKCTPLHLSTKNTSELLARRGADVFAETADGSIALANPLILRDFVSRAWNNVELRERVRREFGWTWLHLACCLLKVNGFKDIDEKNLADVNAQVFANSPVWKGCTPLHLLMRQGDSHIFTIQGQNFYPMTRILLEHGADVTAADDQRDTPISVQFNSSIIKTRSQAALLMKYHRDFNVNPVNAQGISHFHVACFLNDVDAVRKFLEHGVDVNQPIGYFANWCPGCTPLHLATKIEVLDLLINHGADVNIENVLGCSALTEALKRSIFDESVILKIIGSGADANRPNLRGETPFEIAISSDELTMKKLTFYIREGFHVNSCNPITGVGYIAIILKKPYDNQNLQMRIVETIMSKDSTTTLGRSTFHHFVTVLWPNISLDDHVIYFERLSKSGVDIDEQDDKGTTALHLAVEFSNRKAVAGLLISGADANILDANGKPAFAYVSSHPISTHLFSRSEGTLIAGLLRAHARMLAFFNLDSCQIDTDAVAYESVYDMYNRAFFEQINANKNIEIGVRCLRLKDFLTETGAIAMYPHLKQSERSEIDRYFESINDNVDLIDIRGLLKLQYRKAVKRLELLSLAMNSFRSLLGFDLPDLCVENLFMYLRNSDLKNIVSADIGSEATKMDVD